MTNRTPPLGFETRAATVAASSVNVEKRTAEIIWTTGARVARSSWSDGNFLEELSLDKKHVRMGRLNSGRAPLLLGHNGGSVDAVVGVIESARLEATRGVATVRFAKDARSEEIFQKVADGILASISVGYRIHKLVKVEGGDAGTPVFRAEDWEPFEASLVPMPADAGSFVRSSTNPSPGETDMETEEQIRSEERTRHAGISRACRTAKLDQSFADSLIADPRITLDQARALVIDELAKRSDALPTENHVRVTGGNDLGNEGVNQRLRLQAEAISARAGGPAPSDQAKQYMRLRIVDHAKLCLEARGISTRMLSDSQIITRSGGTGDWPALLQATGDRTLMEAYKTVIGGVKSLAKPVFAKDFRPMSRLRVSEAPTLEELPEHAEITHGKMTESKETFSVKTYARIFGLTRKAQINDDLGAFNLLADYGKVCAEKENDLLLKLLTSNPAMEDTFPLFSTQHANLSAAPGAIDITTLGAGMKALRLQKGLDGTTPINGIPDRLLVPAALEVVALQYTQQLAWTQATNVQPIRLEVIVDPRLDAISQSAWYLFASSVPCMEIAHLDGSNGPLLDVQAGFEVDGIKFRARLDVGAGVVDFRGAYKNS